MSSKGSRDLVDTTYAQAEGGEEYLRLLEGALAKGECPFCRPNLFENNEIVAITGSSLDAWALIINRWPYENTDCHLLIIPEEHKIFLSEVSKDDWGAIQGLVATATACFPTLAIGGGLAIRFGRNSGVTIRHLHFHLISPVTNPETGKVFPSKHVNFPIG